MKPMREFRVVDSKVRLEQVKDVVFAIAVLGICCVGLAGALDSLLHDSEELSKRVVSIALGVGVGLWAALGFVVFSLELLLDVRRRGLSVVVSDDEIVLLRKGKRLVVQNADVAHIVDCIRHIDFLLYVNGELMHLRLQKNFFKPTDVTEMMSALSLVRAYTNATTEAVKIAKKYRLERVFGAKKLELHLHKLAVPESGTTGGASIEDHS